jgi:hypothetical protein
MGDVAIIFAPTATKLPASSRGAVLVTGSHGGVYPGRLAAKAGVRAAIFHDAGIGRDAAGIGWSGSGSRRRRFRIFRRGSVIPTTCFRAGRSAARTILPRDAGWRPA